MKTNAVVIGGGVAGISAAIELAEKGLEVHLVEASNKMGGKVNGWYNNQGQSLEHGMHGWWLEYNHFRDLIERIGITNNLTELISPFNVVHRNGKIDVFTFSQAPSPFHALGMLKGLKSVNLRGKLSSLRAGVAIASFDPHLDYARYDNIDFRSWLIKKGVSQSAYEAIYKPTILSNLFLPPEKVSAASALNALLIGLRKNDSWRFSWLRGNPGTYLFEPMAEYFKAKGGKILLNHSLTKLTVKDHRVKKITLINDDGEQSVSANYIVMALDINAVKKIIDPSLKPYPFFSDILNLNATDVLVTRNWIYGDIRLELPHGVLNNFRIVDAFINVSEIQPESKKDGMTLIETQSYLGKEWMSVSDDKIKELVKMDLSEAIPELKQAVFGDSIVIKHHDIFSAFTPGFETHRPTTNTPIENLFLAGDWVKADIPVMFMENAVLTGRCAANGILTKEKLAPAIILPLSPPDKPVQFLNWTSKQMKRAKSLLNRVFNYTPINQP